MLFSHLCQARLFKLGQVQKPEPVRPTVMSSMWAKCKVALTSYYWGGDKRLTFDSFCNFHKHHSCHTQTHSHAEVWSHQCMTHRGCSTAGRRCFNSLKSPAHAAKVIPKWTQAEFTSCQTGYKVSEAYSTGLFSIMSAAMRYSGRRGWTESSDGPTDGRRRRRWLQQRDIPSPFFAPRELPCIQDTNKTRSPSFRHNCDSGKLRKTTAPAVTVPC